MLGATYDKVAVQRSRKALAERVREDWDKVVANVAKPKDDEANPELAELSLPPSTAVEWRERTYASSDPSSGESSESDETQLSPVQHEGHPTSTHRACRTGLASPTRRLFRNHHCMFPDGSDADGGSSTDSLAEVTRRKQERKRRRRQRLEEEMSWNNGLRNWELTRDIWCRARRVSNDFSSSNPLPTSSSAGTSLSSSSTVHSEDKLKSTEDSPITPPVLAGTLDSHSKPALPHHPQTTITRLPIPLPIIPPSDPGRYNIEAQYSLIYEKVVVESLRPQVPINLAHLVPALVKGWKDNDEWPPKASYPAPPITSPKTTQAASPKRGKQISMDLAEKGRRFLWPGHLGSSPKNKTFTSDAGIGGAKDEGTGSSTDLKDKELSTVRRMAKALKGSLSGTSEEKL